MADRRTPNADGRSDAASAISERGVPLEFPSCAICGGREVVVVCDADDVRAQLQWLARFHARRLKPDASGRPPRAALEDRAEFTQRFVTNVVACAACGLVFRDPRPTADA